MMPSTCLNLKSQVTNTGEIVKEYGSGKENQQYKDCELTFII